MESNQCLTQIEIDIKAINAKIAKLRKPSRKKQTKGRQYARSMMMMDWSIDLITLAIRYDKAKSK